ncbi:MAG: XTP/dITP diphosphatase [Promethearchaeota archaeon]
MCSTTILFATSNKHKLTEAKAILSQVGISIKQYPHRPPELQADSLEEIARHSVEQILQEVSHPVFVEDAGMFIHHLNGFPGPYSHYVLDTIGNVGILKLMKDVENRRAVFRSAVAFASPSQHCKIFIGETLGYITKEIRGSHWGFDPVFVPIEGDGRTYAEMGAEKNKYSHRARALSKLAEWLSKQQQTT